MPLIYTLKESRNCAWHVTGPLGCTGFPGFSPRCPFRILSADRLHGSSVSRSGAE